MPQWPSILQHLTEITVEEMGEHIQNAIAQQRGHEAEVREMLEYYHGLTDDPGEIVFRIDVPDLPPDFFDVCRELEVTWLLSSPVDASASPSENIEQIRKGPPA